VRKIFLLFLLASLASVSAVAGTVYQLPQIYESVPSAVIPSPYNFDTVQAFGLDFLGRPTGIQITNSDHVNPFWGWSIRNPGTWSQISGPETGFLAFDSQLTADSLPAYLDVYLISGATIQYAERWSFRALPTLQNPFSADIGRGQIPASQYAVDNGTGLMNLIRPVTATPEPGTIVLMACGGILLLLSGKLRKKKYTA
jgi:hypothetical protein